MIKAIYIHFRNRKIPVSKKAVQFTVVSLFTLPCLLFHALLVTKYAYVISTHKQHFTA